MTTRKEFELISEIASRAQGAAHTQGVSYDRVTALMDISKAHDQYPLKLDELLAADNFNFTHDVFGIANNMNRETGVIENFFVPRFAQ